MSQGNGQPASTSQSASEDRDENAGEQNSAGETEEIALKELFYQQYPMWKEWLKWLKAMNLYSVKEHIIQNFEVRGSASMDYLPTHLIIINWYSLLFPEDNEQSARTSQASEDRDENPGGRKSVEETEEIAVKELVQFYQKYPMWKELLKAMNCYSVKEHIIRLLELTGFGSYQALKQLDEKDIDFIEKFVRSGDILNRIDQKDISKYLGDCKDKEKFTFLVGSAVGGPKAKRARSEEVFVNSLDIAKEVLDIKKILKDHCKSKKDFYPPAISNTVPTLKIVVKTIDTTNKSYLNAIITCGNCSKGQSVQRLPNETWNVSNMNRHWRESHVKKGNFAPGSLDSFVTVNKSADLNATSSSSNADMNIDLTQENTKSDDEDDPSETRSSSIEKHSGSNDDSSIHPSGNVGDENESTGVCLISPSIKPVSRFADVKYSRLERRRRALGKHDSGQTKITAYYELLNDIEITLRSNEDIIKSLSARCEELSVCVSEFKSKKSNLTYLLDLLLDTALKNCEREKHGRRYEDEIKYFAVYLFIVAGRFTYEWLYDNLQPALPSLSEVERILSSTSTPVTEGKFRFEELCEFIKNKNLPKKVFVSEDGTRIIQKFVFDLTSDQIIGPVLPLSQNGVPIINSFPASSAAMIAKHFEQGVPSSTAYAIMAQAVQDGAPSFCLNIFGTDNKFETEHVFKRWHFIHSELAKRNIEVVGFAGDGDPKILGAMQSQLFSEGPKTTQPFQDFYFACEDQKFFVLQDFIHTVNKFRHRLSPSIYLPFGKFTASPSHLRILITERSKNEHLLNPTDLEKDKMNFNSSVKICSDKVRELLSEHVPGSEVVASKLEGKIGFPRERRKRLLSVLSEEKLKNSYLPTNEEIKVAVMHAKDDATSVLLKLGVCRAPDFTPARMKSCLLSVRTFDQDETLDNVQVSYEANVDEDDIPLHFLQLFPTPDSDCVLDPFGELSESNYLFNRTHVPVPDKNNGFKLVPKSLLCYLLSSSESPTVNNIRIYRVREKVLQSLGRQM
ncbi:Acyl carrier protein 4, chloroplastic [Frankliniella fusca]|uniref:Acyl carrier protein 4, chloroplastic n=1 Tax=Frankliniella fusca TaxID=407009 RepID=A0AAE1LF25_9NEOP|nr:Acyl carrier protein 4, chloroplastic [Frankliniella fusca]